MGTLAKENPPIFGMIQRTGEVVIRMLANVQRVTIAPLIRATIAAGSVVYTDEYDIDNRLSEWGYSHHTVCHARGEYAWDDDGDGFCEVHVNTLEGFWSLLRSWLRPHRGNFTPHARHSNRQRNFRNRRADGCQCLPQRMDELELQRGKACQRTGKRFS